MTELEIFSKLQQMQDKKGYLVLGVLKVEEPRRIGEVITRVGFGERNLDCTVAIVDFATEDEWKKQAIELFGSFEIKDPTKWEFVKVRAE